MNFHDAGAGCDESSIFAGYLGRRTSMRIAVDAWRRESRGFDCGLVTEGVSPSVAIDEHRKPRPVPPSASWP
jgi:acyl-CoA thioesterase YciA